MTDGVAVRHYYILKKACVIKMLKKICLLLSVATVMFSTFSINTFAIGDDENELEIMTNPDYQYQKGDVNFDGKVNVVDAIYVQRYLVELADLTTSQISLGDVNLNGKVDVGDVICIQKKVLGIETEITTESSTENDGPIELPFIPTI